MYTHHHPPTGNVSNDVTLIQLLLLQAFMKEGKEGRR
jgi:hypothetical protein